VCGIPRALPYNPFYRHVSTERLVAIWNSLPGVTPMKRFKNSHAAARRISDRIEACAPPPSPPAKPKAERKAQGGARAAKGAPAKAQATHGGHCRQEHAPAQKRREEAAPREGSKTAQVVAMLQRKNGATLSEIVDQIELAEAHGPRVHGRRDEEGRTHRLHVTEVHIGV
jgi:hypothetical protein